MCEAPDFIIRPAQSADLKQIVALWRALQITSATYESRLAPNAPAGEWYADFLYDQLGNANASVLVAAQGADILGYVFGQVMQRPTLASGDCGYVADLCVQDGHRGQGIGRALYETLKTWFNTKGLRAIEVQVVRANPASQAFWRKMGFRDFLRTLRTEA